MMKSSLKNCFILLVFAVVLFSCATGGKTQQLSGRARPYERQGRIFLQQQNYERAMEQYLLILENDPEHIESLKTVADLYFLFAEDAEGEEAREIFEIAYQLFVHTIETMLNIPDWISYNNFAVIKEDSELKLASIFARIFVMGQEYYLEEDFDKAEEIFYDLVRLYPERIEPVQMLAAIANTRGDTEKAIQYFLRILETDPTNTQILINLALEYQAQNDYENSIRFFTMLIDIEPENVSGYISLAYVYMEMENFEAAFNIYERAIQIEPDNIDLISDVANIAQTINNDERVLYYLRRLVQLERSEDNVTYLVYYLARMQHWQDLLTYARIWHEINPNIREAVQFIIHAAYQLDNQEILREYQEVINRMD